VSSQVWTGRTVGEPQHVLLYHLSPDTSTTPVTLSSHIKSPGSLKIVIMNAACLRFRAFMTGRKAARSSNMLRSTNGNIACFTNLVLPLNPSASPQLYCNVARRGGITVVRYFKYIFAKVINV